MIVLINFYFPNPDKEKKQYVFIIYEQRALYGPTLTE